MEVLFQIAQIQGNTVYYTNEQGVDNSIENLRQLHSCKRNYESLLVVNQKTQAALDKSESLNAAKDSIIHKKDEILVVADKKNAMLMEDNRKLKSFQKLAPWLIGLATAIGFILGSQ